MTKPAAAVSPATAKLELLNHDLARLLQDGLIVAFSGGVDSTFLLWAAEEQRKRTGGRLLALTTSSESLSAVELEDVTTFVSEHDIPHVMRESRELLDPK